MPLRFVAEILGASIEWDSKSQSILITKGLIIVSTKDYADFPGFPDFCEYFGAFPYYTQYTEGSSYYRYAYQHSERKKVDNIISAYIYELSSRGFDIVEQSDEIDYCKIKMENSQHSVLIFNDYWLEIVDIRIYAPNGVSGSGKWYTY